MKDLIVNYIDKNPTFSYGDLGKIFGLSLKEITNLLYGKNFRYFKSDNDLRVVDLRGKVYYFEKVQDGYSPMITKYVITRNKSGLPLTLIKNEHSLGYNASNYFYETINSYDNNDKLISKRDSLGNILIIDYSESYNIKCYMNKTLCADSDKKIKWLEDSLNKSELKRIKLLEMISDE